MGEKCNRDCFNCIYKDCVVQTMTKEEREEANKRDKMYASYANIPISKKSKRVRRAYK